LLAAVVVLFIGSKPKTLRTADASPPA